MLLHNFAHQKNRLKAYLSVLFLETEVQQMVHCFWELVFAQIVCKAISDLLECVEPFLPLEAGALLDNILVE